MTLDDSALREGILAGDEGGLRLALAWARRLLERLDTTALLRAGPPPLAALAELVGPLDHVGFIAQPRPLDVLEAAAAAEGFAASRTFASRILSRYVCAVR